MEHKSPWKEKLDVLVNTCQDELKKTAEIGKKMLSASRENSLLSDAYEKLGKYTFEAMKNKDLKWDDEKANQTVTDIVECLEKLENIESDVQNIKKDPSKG
jgi:hypothetical protein